MYILVAYVSVFFSSTKTMTKLFVNEPVLIFVDETKIATIMQAISSTWRKRRQKWAYFRRRDDHDNEN